MLVPLLVRGRKLGMLTLGLEAPARRFDSDTLTMVAELATRAATALDNSLLFRKIQEEDQRKNELLAMLAHELRNPPGSDQQRGARPAHQRKTVRESSHRRAS